MAKKITLQAGDRIAYAASFLKNTGQFANGSGERRGTFVSVEPQYFAGGASHGRVRWDDFEALVARGTGQYGDLEWVQDCRDRGQLIALSAIAKVGSVRVQ